MHYCRTLVFGRTCWSNVLDRSSQICRVGRQRTGSKTCSTPMFDFPRPMPFILKSRGHHKHGLEQLTLNPTAKSRLAPQQGHVIESASIAESSIQLSCRDFAASIPTHHQSIGLFIEGAKEYREGAQPMLIVRGVQHLANPVPVPGSPYAHQLSVQTWFSRDRAIHPSMPPS